MFDLLRPGNYHPCKFNRYTIYNHQESNLIAIKGAQFNLDLDVFK